MGTMWCVKCHMEAVATKRHEAGYITCLRCGEDDARKRKFCVVPMHKSNYVVVSDKNLLLCLNKVAR
jgi:hypothetical protein